MNDQQASVTLEAVLELAVAVRDDGPDAVERALLQVRAACGGDLAGALVVAAALVRVDLPVDAWWQRGLAGVGAGPVAVPVVEPVPEVPGLAPHGTHAAFNRHKKAGEPACPACRAGERDYQADRQLARRAARVPAGQCELVSA